MARQGKKLSLLFVEKVELETQRKHHLCDPANADRDTTSKREECSRQQEEEEGVAHHLRDYAQQDSRLLPIVRDDHRSKVPQQEDRGRDGCPEQRQPSRHFRRHQAKQLLAANTSIPSTRRQYIVQQERNRDAKQNRRDGEGREMLTAAGMNMNSE